MLPAPPTKKPNGFYDTESYPNFWLLRLKIGVTHYVFRLDEGQSLSAADRQTIAHLFDIVTSVSFNGIGYDVPMICAALSGYTTEQLYWLTGEIIGTGLNPGKKPWELSLPMNWQPADHIDIMEVLPGAGSQKLFAGRIHYHTMRDLPYELTKALTEDEKLQVIEYCGNDLGQLEAEFDSLDDQIDQRIALAERYGNGTIDFRSKSDAQCAEAAIRWKCEQALGCRIYKQEPDWNLRFPYEPPTFLAFSTPQMVAAFETIKGVSFRLGASGAVEMPEAIQGLHIGIGKGVYRMGIGGLHSSEKRQAFVSNATHVLRDIDVASYYPSLILNSGKFPKALGPIFLEVLREIKDVRLLAKALQTKLEDAGFKGSVEWKKARTENEGGKIMINGTFGKTGSPFSILFAPEMMIQTTLTGQLSLLMLIEWHEYNGIQVVSANTDGMVIYCPRNMLGISDALIAEWEHRTNLQMEKTEYKAIYSRDVNNYFALKTKGGVKRKGAYAKADLIAKKSPHVEICGDAVAEYLENGTPLSLTVMQCKDIRKFVTVRQVNGGGVKMWGESSRKEMKAAAMPPDLLHDGWTKVGTRWNHPLKGTAMLTRDAHKLSFPPQRPEYVGKAIRWYYSTQAPGSIVYKTDGSTVSLSYGARPCMILPKELPPDIDYGWYINTATEILHEIGAIS